MRKELRIAIITNILPPYRVAQFSALNTRVDSLHVYLLSETEPNRSWRVDSEDGFPFRVTILPGFSIAVGHERHLHFNFGVYRYIAKNRYDVIGIGGYSQISYWEALLTAKMTGTKVLFFLEGQYTNRSFRNHPFELIKRMFIKSCDAFAPAGLAVKRWLLSLDAKEDLLSIAPFCCDNNWFFYKRDEVMPGRILFRNKKIINGKVVILFIGQIIERKGIKILVQAFKRLISDGAPVHLVVAGDGPLRQTLNNVASQHVTFLGHVEATELAVWYAASDIFVLPSLSEPWGIVVNEAMIFGLPIVVTDAVGCSRDLVLEGVNGVIVPSGDVEALYRVLKMLVADHKLRVRMGNASRQIIAYQSPEAWADGFIRAFEIAMRRM